MKKLKKIIAVFVATVMLLTTMPVASVMAEEAYLALTLDTAKSVSVKGEDVVLSFTPKNDGFYKFVSVGSYDTVATLYDSEWNKLSYGDESSNANFEIIEKLSAGCVYYLSVNEYYGSSASFKVKVSEAVGLESATIVKYPDNMTCVEGYERSSYSLDGLEILFVSTEGEEISWTYSSPENVFVGDFRITFDRYLGDDGYYYVALRCAGTETELQYEIIENPVDRIEYHSNEDIILYEESGGYYFGDNFIYSYSLPDDAYFTIYYKDGTSVDCKEYEDVNGGYVYEWSDQYDNPWSVGTNYCYATYMGVETQIPVYVKSCPFKSITINSLPEREYMFGDDTYGYLDERNKYNFVPTDITGLSFSVEYEDGTKELFNDMDFDIENGTIAGCVYSVDECVLVRPNTTTATLHFMGAEIKYNITVVESPLKNFEMTWYPDITDYEDRYDPVFDGAQFTLTFKDGTKQVVTLSDENTSYGDGGWLSYEVKAGDFIIHVYRGSNEYDEPIYGFSCVDKWVEYEGIWFDESREIDSAEIVEFTPDADGMVICVRYTDGSEDTLTYDTVSSSKYNWGYRGYAKTENGLVDFEMHNIYENGEVVGYTVHTLGEEFTVMGSFVNVGDVDGDGEITIMDATLVQLHIAQKEVLSGTELQAADADNDGEITIIDATHIQRYIAKEFDKL